MSTKTAKHVEGRLRGRRRKQIYWQAWYPSGTARGSVVIAHGLGEHGGRYSHVAAELVAAGLNVYAIDHRGHGQSAGGGSALLDRWRNAVADLDQLVEQARNEAGGKPVFLLGHSMGGALSLAYTAQHQEKLAGLLLSGPAVALDGAPPFIGPVAKFLSVVVPRLGLFGIDPTLVSRDPAAASAYAADPLNCHGKVPARTLAEIVRLVEQMPRLLPKIRLPLLIMHGTDDKLAGTAGSRRVLDAVSSKDKTLLLYKGLYHEIFNEIPADRAKVFEDMNTWLETRLGKPTSRPARPARKKTAA